MIRTKVVIIGAGPAGVAAAVQLKRNDIDFIVFERHRIGGLAANANFIENYPGFPKGISGNKFVLMLERHFANLDITPMYSEVKAADFNNNIFTITTNKETYLADYLIIATGTMPLQDKSILIKPEAQPKVFYEIAEAGLDNVKLAAIIGGGDAAFDYALNLSAHGISSTIYIRGELPKALPLLIRRVAADQNISIQTNMKLKEISGTNIINTKIIHKKRELSVKSDCIFIAIGRRPTDDFFSEHLRRQLSALQEKSKLFLTGDINNSRYRQVAIAAGDGLRAAMEIVQSIEKENESNRKNKG